MPRPSPSELLDAPLYRLVDEEGEASPTFRAVRGPEGAWLSDGTLMEAERFEAAAVRCDDGGGMIIPVRAGIDVQLLALGRQGASRRGHLSGHLADVSALRAAMPAPETVEDAGLRQEIHLHDALHAAPRDPVLPQRHFEDEAARRAADAPDDAEGILGMIGMLPAEEQTPDMVLARLEKDTGIDVEEWVEVKAYPTYMIEPIRAMARAMLAPILGNMTALEDLRRLEVPKNEVERFGALMRWMRDAGEVKTLPPFTHPAMPGYVTSEPMLAELNGVTLLVFKDFKASYAYAWQSDPDLAPVVDPDADEDEVGPDGPFMPRR